MKHFILTLILLPFFTFCGQQKEQNIIQKSKLESQGSETISAPLAFHDATYYLIRHAEKVRTDPKDENPSLNAAGIKRAKAWAIYFDSIHLDEIYETQYKRTHQTISYIAENKEILPKIYDPSTIYSEEFLKETKDKSVLIVGHSNSIPYFVNNLMNEVQFKDMDDSDNATLFKVTIRGDDKKVETITID